MAQVIYTSKPSKPELTKDSVYGRNNKNSKKIPLFRKINYILMVVGVVVLAAGYVALSGGAADDPSHFSEAIFDSRRLVVAPILMLAGLVIEIVAIMYHPKNKKDTDDNSTNDLKAE